MQIQEPTNNTHRSPWRRPWILPLAVVLSAFLLYSLPPYLGLDPAQSRSVLNDAFPLHYPLLIIHIVSGSIAMITVCLQVWPWLRRQHPAVHRISGRLYVFAGALPSSLVAVIMLPFSAQPNGNVGAMLASIGWFVTTAMGYVRIRQRRYGDHRRWMIYSFGLAVSIVWGRLIGIGLGPIILAAGVNPMLLAEAAGWMGAVINVLLAHWWLSRGSNRQSGRPSLQ